MTSEIQDMMRLWGMFDDSPKPVPKPFDSLPLRAKVQVIAQSMVNGRRFKLLCAFFVMSSLPVIAVDIDHAAALPGASFSFWVVISITTSLELVVRILAHPSDVLRAAFLLDATMCASSWFIFSVQLADGASPILPMTKAAGVLRVHRLQTMVEFDRDIEFWRPLRILAQAVRDSIFPLGSVFVLATLSLMSVALLLTSLVPGAAADLGEAETAVILEYFGSIPMTCFSLVEVIVGCAEYGFDIVSALWVGAESGKLGAMMLAVALAPVLFSTRILFNLLTVGTFMERLIKVADHEDKRMDEEIEADNRDFFTRFIESFRERGFEGPIPATWRDVSAILDEMPDLHAMLPKREAQELFAMVDEDADGLVRADEFVFGALKLRAFSSSTDMLALNYQQTQVVQRLRQVQKEVDIGLAGVQNRLSHIDSRLAALKLEVEALHESSTLVRDLAAEYAEKRRAVSALDGEAAKNTKDIFHNAGVDGLSMPRRMEELRARTDLNLRLDGLHRSTTTLAAVMCSLKEGPPSQTRGQAVAMSFVEEVAEAMVRSVRQSLQQELFVLT